MTSFIGNVWSNGSDLRIYFVSWEMHSRVWPFSFRACGQHELGHGHRGSSAERVEPWIFQFDKWYTISQHLACDACESRRDLSDVNVRRGCFLFFFPISKIHPVTSLKLVEWGIMIVHDVRSVLQSPICAKNSELPSHPSMPYFCLLQ
jgi:hypothetical protein